MKMSTKLKGMTWPKVAALIVMLLGSVLASQGVISEDQYANFAEFAREIARQEVLDYLEPLINPKIYTTARDYNFAVIDVADYAILFNGSSNKIQDWKQNDDGLVGNWALNNLTAGRTWYERVAFIGNFTITEKLVPDDYPTEIHILGVLKGQDLLNDAIFEKATAGSGLKFIGGEIDGNIAGQTTINVGRGIELRYVDDITIENVYIHNTKGEAVRLRDGERASLSYTAENCEGAFLNLYNFSFAEGSVIGQGSTDDAMFQILYGSTYNNLDLIGKNGSEEGVRFVASASVPTHSNKIEASLYDLSTDGAYFGTYTYNNHLEITATEIDEYGIEIVYNADQTIAPHDNTIEAILKDVGTDGGSTYGGAIIGGSRNNIKIEVSGILGFFGLEIYGDNNTINLSQINGTGSPTGSKGISLESTSQGTRVFETDVFGWSTAGARGIDEESGTDLNIIIGCNIWDVTDNDFTGTNSIRMHNIGIADSGAAGGSNQTHGWDYIVVKEGSNFVSYEPDGDKFYEGTNAYLAIQNSVNETSKSSGGAVLYNSTLRLKAIGAVLLGPYVFPIGANTILLPNHFSLEGSGPGTTIIEHTDPNGIQPMWFNFTYDVYVGNLMVEGDAGAGDTGIYWVCDIATLPSIRNQSATLTYDYYSWWLRLENLYIRGETTMFRIETVTTGINNFVCVNAIRGTGNIYIERVFDSHFYDILCSTLTLVNIVTNHFQDIYIGSGQMTISGGTLANPCKGNTFNGIRSDNTLNAPSLQITGYATENTLVNCQLANCRDQTGDNTEDCIDIGGNVSYLTITASYIGNYPSRSNIDTWRYGVRVRSGAHNITITACVWTFDQFDSGALLLDDGPRRDLNFEDRLVTFYGGSSDAITPGASQYCTIQGIYTLGTTQSTRSTIIDVPGYWANLRIRMSGVAGAGETYDLYVRIASTNYLQVDIDGASETYDFNDGSAYHDPGTEPDYASIYVVSSGGAGTYSIHSIVDFYADLEYFMSQ